MYLQRSHISESDRTKLDLNILPPCYADGVYLSEKCRPSAGEHVLMQGLSQRPKTTVHDAALTIDADQAAAADNMEDFIRVRNTYRVTCVDMLHTFTVLNIHVLLV